MAQNRPHLIIAVLAILFGSLLAAPAQAGKAEMDLLASYIGKWAGDSVLEGGKAPEPFRCRLTIAKGNSGQDQLFGPLRPGKHEICRYPAPSPMTMRPETTRR